MVCPASTVSQHECRDEEPFHDVGNEGGWPLIWGEHLVRLEVGPVSSTAFLTQFRAVLMDVSGVFKIMIRHDEVIVAFATFEFVS